MKRLSFLILIVGVVSCSPKIQQIEEEVSEVEQAEPVKPQPRKSPCTMLSDLSGAVKEQTENAYVLYRDQLKLKNYDEALKLWSQAYYNAPAANGSIKYQYEDGIKIYKALYNRTDDDGLKAAYVDTVMSIYNKRESCFGEPAYIAGRKAFDLYYSFNNHIETDSIYRLFKKAVDGKKERSDYFVINPFTKILADKVAEESVPITEARRYAELLWDAIEYGNASGKNEEAWAIINDYALPRLTNLEGVKNLFGCDHYIDKYYSLYEQDSTDCEVINTAYSRLLWGECGKDNPYVTELARVKEERCYTPPPPPGKLRQAYDAYSEGDYNNAIALFGEFVEQTEDTEKKYKYNLLIAKIYYADIKNFPKSRAFAMKASEIKPEAGEPYLLIGKLYASSGPLCGPGRGWDSQIVTWPAIDMFEMATRDPATEAEARKLIRTYWQYMPKKEDIFQRTIKAGSTFRVGCWINRTTVVRTAN